MQDTEMIRKAQDTIDKSEFIKMLNIEILDLSSDYARGRMPFDRQYCNPYGSMHGGCLYALADTVTGILADNAGCDVTTVEGNLCFLEAAVDTAYVYCEATMKRCGKHLITVSAEIKDDAGKLLDCGNFVFFKMLSQSD